MTTLPEIDLQNALAEYAKANGANLIDDNCWILPTGQRTGYADLSGLQWTHETIPAPTEAELITIYDTWQAAHTADMSASETKAIARTLLLSDAKNYLSNQLQGASPNVTNIYNAVKTYVDGNATLSQMLENQISLFNLAYNVTINTTTPTAADRARYLVCCQLVLASIA